MSRNDAKNLLRTLKVLKLRRAPMKRLLNQSLEIALNNTLAVYDSGYIALALRYGYSLISIDQPQIRAASAEGVTLISITQYK
jgi:predicted nucleic acid-binding protein